MTSHRAGNDRQKKTSSKTKSKHERVRQGTNNPKRTEHSQVAAVCHHHCVTRRTRPPTTGQRWATLPAMKGSGNRSPSKVDAQRYARYSPHVFGLAASKLPTHVFFPRRQTILIVPAVLLHACLHSPSSAWRGLFYALVSESCAMSERVARGVRRWRAFARYQAKKRPKLERTVRDEKDHCLIIVRVPVAVGSECENGYDSEARCYLDLSIDYTGIKAQWTPVYVAQLNPCSQNSLSRKASSATNFLHQCFKKA